MSTKNQKAAESLTRIISEQIELFHKNQPDLIVREINMLVKPNKNNEFAGVALDIGLNSCG